MSAFPMMMLLAGSLTVAYSSENCCKNLMERLIAACEVKPIGSWQWLFQAFWLYGAVEPATG